MANREPEIIFERTPDTTEKVLRVGCGGLVGIVAAVFLGIHLWPTALGFVVLAVTLALICSWLALRYGDHFFYEALKWFRWL